MHDATFSHDGGPAPQATGGTTARTAPTGGTA